jgi:sugar fermentation stimulation protein A
LGNVLAWVPFCWRLVRLKSVTLCRQAGLAEFPDSVTKRGAKHLAELANMREAGHRAVMLYLVQRTDCTAMTLASDIDPTYAQAFADAQTAGVEAICLDTKITPEGVWICKPLTILLAP